MTLLYLALLYIRRNVNILMSRREWSCACTRRGGGKNGREVILFLQKGKFPETQMVTSTPTATGRV